MNVNAPVLKWAMSALLFLGAGLALLLAYSLRLSESALLIGGVACIVLTVAFALLRKRAESAGK